MAVITKLKIFANGRMEAGQFVEDSSNVKLGADSVAHCSEIDETGDSVMFKSDGKIVASELVEI